MNSRRRFLVRGSLLGLAAVGIAAGVFVLSTVPPTQASFYPKCTLYQTTGLHCPGCGTTRAFYSLFNGRFEEAVGFNLLALLVTPYVVFATVRTTWNWLWGVPTRTRTWPPKLMWGLVILVIVFWVARNIPLYPFTLLAPHEIPQ